MSDNEFLAREFDGHRTRLRSVAYRILGTYGDADDAVQEAWLRLSWANHDEIENLDAWLTTVVSRVCLDMLRSRRSRGEQRLDTEYVTDEAGEGDPEVVALQQDSVGAALIVVLETLTPAERLAFVLHDLFAVPFDQIAAVIEKSTAATRQLASRARRRVNGADVPRAREHQRSVVSAFLHASREGDLTRLLEVLDPELELRADRVAVAAAAVAPAGAPDVDHMLHGAAAVAAAFRGRAKGAELALIDGVVGAVYAPGGHVMSALAMRIDDAGRLVRIDITADPVTIAGLDIEVLGTA